MVKLLQIFNRYLDYGGEEGSVQRVASVLRSEIEVYSYTGSTAEILKSPLGKLQMPFLMQNNRAAVKEIRQLQEEHQFHVWQIHNVFPALSVAIYELANELSIPVIQYLHNYRFGCVNATYFREGSACYLCSPSHYVPGIKHKCWRGSTIASVSMALALGRFWSRGESAISVYIAISESQKKRHIAMGIPAGAIHVVPHFLEIERAQVVSPPELGDVLFIGRLTEEKGVKLLIESWGKVRSGGRLLRIVGEGPLEEELKSMVAQNRIENVVFEGFVPKDQHGRLWDSAAFFVAPSIWEEPFGMVVLESWAHKRPVLATNLGSFPDMIEHGVDGWLAEADSESFSIALQEALEESCSYVEKGLKGDQKLRQDYSKEVWLNRWAKAVESAIHLNQEDAYDA